METKSINSFENIQNCSFTYVDKTASILKLLNLKSNCFQLLAPDGFGKTLLLDTLESIFSSNKNLFKGLSIYNSNYSWKYYKTFRFDLSSCKLSPASDLALTLVNLIRSQIARLNLGIDLDLLERSALVYEDEPEELLSFYLDTLFLRINADKQPVVFLIDNYDWFILDKLSSQIDFNLYTGVSNLFSLFYKKILQNKASLRLLMITGVMKLDFFQKFYSDNLIEQIDQGTAFHNLLGYSYEEIQKYFKDSFDIILDTLDLDKIKFKDRITLWYGGYGNSNISLYYPKMINSLFKETGPLNYFSYLKTSGYQNNLIKSCLQKNPLLTIDTYLNEGYLDFYQTNFISPLNPNPLYLLYALGILTVQKEDKYTNGSNICYLAVTNKQSRLILSNYICDHLFNLSSKLKSTLGISINTSLLEQNITSLTEEINLLLKGNSYSNLASLKSSLLYGLYYLLDRFDDVRVSIGNIENELSLIVSYNNLRYILTVSYPDSIQKNINSTQIIKTIKQLLSSDKRNKKTHTKYTTILIDSTTNQISDIKIDEL